MFLCYQGVKQYVTLKKSDYKDIYLTINMKNSAK